MSGVVTPEGVRLEFEPAGVGSRAVAFVLDLLVQATAVVVCLFGLGLVVDGAGGGIPDWVGVTLTLLLVFAILWGYPVAFETLWRGRTLGKAVVGLRVVTREGAPVRFRHAAIRAALGLVDFYLAAGGVAVISALVTPRNQRLGDLVAGTLVLRERTGAGPPTAVRFTVPPELASYAATIDPSGLLIDDYAAVRAFLVRAGELRPAVRADLAQRIAEPIRRRLRHRLPDGVSPEAFLLCAAARYQQRAGAGAGPAGGTPATAGGVPGSAPPAPTVPGPPPSASATSRPAPPTGRSPSAPAPPADDGFAPPG